MVTVEYVFKFEDEVSYISAKRCIEKETGTLSSDWFNDIKWCILIWYMYNKSDNLPQKTILGIYEQHRVANLRVEICQRYKRTEFCKYNNWINEDKGLRLEFLDSYYNLFSIKTI